MTDELDKDTVQQPPDSETAESDLRSRRDFLIGLGKWSRVVVTGAVLGAGAMITDKPAQAGWLNRRGYGYGGGGGWINNRGGGGGGWWNARGGGGVGWVNVR
jgi:hypothetical protein